MSEGESLESPSGISEAPRALSMARRWRRLRHLEPLRALIPSASQRSISTGRLVDQDPDSTFRRHPPVRVDEADVAAAGDPEVGVAGLPVRSPRSP